MKKIARFLAYSCVSGMGVAITLVYAFLAINVMNAEEEQKDA